MSIHYTLLDIFADEPFQGTQIPVVVTDDSSLSDEAKTNIASEFQQTETVFIDRNAQENFVSVFNNKGKTLLGAHTILAASFITDKEGLSKDEGTYSSFQFSQNNETINSYVDKSVNGTGALQFARILSPTIDRYTPEISALAQALKVNEKHISYSKYQPMVVSVDRPILIIPFTKAEHVLNVSLDQEKWANLRDLYTSDLFLFAPGSVSGKTDFHGRLLNAELVAGQFPPIGNAMPEFIAYLAEQKETAEGTHTFTIDRGSLKTRKSVLHIEFDKRPGKGVKCRIGGNVIKIGEGTLLI